MRAPQGFSNPRSRTEDCVALGAGATAPTLAIFITVCDSAAAESCPVFFGGRAGAAVKVHWGYPDPSNAEGGDAGQRRAFELTRQAIGYRMLQLLALPLETLDGVALRAARRLKRSSGGTVADMMQHRLPMSASQAAEMGLVDAVFGDSSQEFVQQVRARAAALAASAEWPALLRAKRQQREADEARKPLAAYRDEELQCAPPTANRFLRPCHKDRTQASSK